MNKLRLQVSFLCANTQARCVAIALCCASCVFMGQALTVHFSYGGNWSGLFCTGSEYPPPPVLAQAEDIHRFQDKSASGYDGQFYHYVAHDPFFKRGFQGSVDAPALRYSRILVPGLAYLLALGRDTAIDGAYRFVVIAFIFAGAYWVARLAVISRRSPAWGLLFVAAPAVLISADRLTVDVALAACCAGYALYAREESHHKLFAVLAAAALARETGLLLVAGYVLYLAGRREIKAATMISTAVIPSAGWYLFVRAHTHPNIPSAFSLVPLDGLVWRILNPAPYPFSMSPAVIYPVLDLLALAGIAGALAWAGHRALRHTWTPLAIATYLFAILMIFLPRGDLWSEVYAFGRSLTPLLLLAALDGFMAESVMPVFCLLAAGPRTGLEMLVQIMNVLRGLIR